MGETSPVELLVRAVQDAAELGYTVVGVSGGEPLLYKDLVVLLRAAKVAGLRTTVTSNGMLLTERRLSQLAGLVDVLALSLDGEPATHASMRGDPRAFRLLDSRMAGLQASGIPFGFITTLTMHNAAELEFVVAYARAHGANIVQVHPLEPAGAAITNLRESIPDSQEFAFARLESARLSAQYSIPVQVDVVRRSDLVARPEQFLAIEPVRGAEISTWLTPLVVETDGTVVPLTYGLSRHFSLGNIRDAGLLQLTTLWEPREFQSLCKEVAANLLKTERSYFNWYDEIATAASTRSIESVLSQVPTHRG